MDIERGIIMSRVRKFYNLEEMDGQSIQRKISEMAERERQIYGVKDLNDYILCYL